jgi:hypothetical protein
VGRQRAEAPRWGLVGDRTGNRSCSCCGRCAAALLFRCTIYFLTREPAKISGYLGNSDKFDKAIADFSAAYADQSERDHETLMKAVGEGRLEVFIEGQ